ncbi:hypothetical protein WICPIJ_009096 [Wickerhamomyces pijperi]|uniref:Uncharacterized protein n=1 Tax=Wickerhamomyces pijperi TaxID=599730 RepID=A0A9P8PRX4_WICPI|nr:hypothetical protein WICPIJ_009096 [Wickerhamomyces pijperi]
MKSDIEAEEAATGDETETEDGTQPETDSEEAEAAGAETDALECGHGARSGSGTGSFDNDRGRTSNNSWRGGARSTSSTSRRGWVNIIRTSTLDTLVVPFVLRLTMEPRDTLGVAGVSLTTTSTVGRNWGDSRTLSSRCS